MKDKILDLQSLRESYTKGSLSKKELHANPIKQFKRWWEEAINSEIAEPNTMTLATVDKKGNPSARIVLLKELRKKGFVFYTNYESKKAKDIKGNNSVALVFLWKELQRQVRIEGKIKKISKADSEAYAKTRPIRSQMGAWISEQSKVIKNRKELEAKMKLLEKKVGNKTFLDKPPHWGGYIVIPNKIEFWQGRRSRLHDRLQYRLTKKSNWKIERLSP